jgi:pimeloyl-ACP methyl ester carboxylesterase
MPSHGGSADWDEVSDFSDTVYEAAAATLDDTPMDVVGHSFGAVAALRLAITFPEKVRSLTLIESVFFAVALQDAPETMADHDARAAPFFGAVNAGDISLAARSFNRMWSDGPIWHSLSERSRAAMIRAIHVVPDTFGFLYEDAKGILAPGVLDAATMPSLLVRGSKTLPAVTAINDGLEARLPNASQAVIDGAGHMAPLSHPAQVSDAIRGLLMRS